MRATVPRKFTLLDAMVLIAATGIAFVPIRLFLWENWHFPEELSVPEIWRTGLEINVSLVPLALSLSAAIAGCWRMKKPRPSLRRAFQEARDGGLHRRARVRRLVGDRIRRVLALQLCVGSRCF